MKYTPSVLVFCLIQNIANAGVETDAPAIDELANPSNYPVEVYKGKTKPPATIKKHTEGSWQIWRDEYGKMVADPNINFAGKYFLVVHSCGMGCRWYSLHDMINGKEIPVLGMFTAAEPRPMTRDGWIYMTMLNYKKDSNLLVAQYLLEKHIPIPGDPDGRYEVEYDCRERSYIFENEELKPISKTRYHCTNWSRLNKD